MALDKVLSASIANAAVNASAISNTANLVIGALNTGNTVITGTLVSNAHTITGNLSVTGSTTLTGTQFVNGAVTFANNTSNTVYCNSDGDFIIATNTVINSSRLSINSSTTRNGIGIEVGHSSGYTGISINRTGGDGDVLSFTRAGAGVGSVSASNTGTTYNTTSDRRLKDNITPISDSVIKIMKMNPVSHTWINAPTLPPVHGFIAQDMINVCPEAVNGSANSDLIMTMDYGRITPVIVAALQEALKEIEVLKKKVSDLENM